MTTSLLGPGSIRILKRSLSRYLFFILGLTSFSLYTQAHAGETVCPPWSHSTSHCSDSTSTGSSDLIPDLIGILGTHHADTISLMTLMDVHYSTSLDTGASLAQSYVIGIAGGNGNDTLANHGQLNVTADASIDNSSVALSLVDDGNAQHMAQAMAAGITGNKGHDDIINSGHLTVNANATINLNNYDIALSGGPVDVNASNSAEASVIGISGGQGHDTIKNEGQIDANATAKLDLFELNLNLLGGATSIDATNQATATVTGIDGGDGHDYILNMGTVNTTANASVDSDSVSFSLLSALQGQDVRAPIIVDAIATGINGDKDHDIIDNQGILNVTADAKADALNVDLSVIDMSSGGMSTATTSTATGLNGGSGKSIIENSGDITVNSMATTKTKSFAFTLVDLSLISDIVDLVSYTPINNSTTATSYANGIVTGDDHDSIANYGNLTVTADAKTNTFDMSMSVDGVSNYTSITDFPNFFLQAPIVDASTTATAEVTGISSGKGHDEIINSGNLTAKATADVSAVSVGVDLPLPDLLPQILPSIDTTDVETSATATARGIDTGDGNDTVINSGSIWSEAVANASSVSVNATLDVPTFDIIDYGIPYSIDANLVDVGARSEAQATGISTGTGNDYIYSTGDITAKASTDSVATNIAATVGYSDDKVSVSGSLANASTEGKAEAVAITTSSGNDELLLGGNILADAFVDTNSVGVTVDLQAQKDTILAIGASVTKANTTAETNSTAIDLGEGNDSVHNEGSIIAKAYNNVDAVGVDVGVSIPTGSKFGIIGEGNWVQTDTLATSTTNGILGGAGRDTISNSGTITADAFADPNSVGVTANASGTKKGASVGVALTQARTVGTATSVGISGGADKDELTNTGTVTSKARTDVDSVSVAASLALTGKGVAINGTAADASTTATSTASGMNGDEGDDVIRNTGTVDVLSNADAESVSVSLDVSYASTGVGFGLALSRATSQADATSTGISGGAQNDRIYSSGLTKSHATANVIAGSGGLSAGGTGKGVAINGAAADGSANGTATTTAISGGDGEDFIFNEGIIDALADVDTTSISVGVAANGTGTGVNLGVGLARAISEATATSTGINAGANNDTVYNFALLKSHANADVIAGSGALAGGGSGKGVTLQGAAADGLSTATTNASGITGNGGRDYLHNEGELDINADADTTSVSVAVSANGTGTGLSVGVALARASSEATSNSMGISGGDDNDTINNSGLLTSHAKSNVDAVSVSAALGGAGTGVAIQGAAADASTTSTTNAFGINGDAGFDEIYNSGNLDILADSDANSTSVGVSVSGAGTGVGAGISLARANTESNATATGISLGGNTGPANEATESEPTPEEAHKEAGSDEAHEHDRDYFAYDEKSHDEESNNDRNKEDWQQAEYLENFGDIKAEAQSDATSVSVSAQLGITGTGLQAGGALVDASTHANADSIAIEGSQHRDTVINHGSIEAITDADAATTSVGVSINASLEGATLGTAITDATAMATANSTGIAGLAANDELVNHGSVTARAKAETDAVSVSVPIGIAYVPISVAVADNEAVATAFAAGLDGGDGHDYLASTGDITVNAETETDGIAVSVAPIGVSLASASLTADSTAIGINGADGEDAIYQTYTAVLNATSKADVTGTVVNATLLGASGTIVDDASSTANARSTGIDGGEGSGLIENHGSITTEARTKAKGTSVSVSLAGAAFSDVSTYANSYATAIAAGSGTDKIYNDGAISSYAESIGEGTSVAAGLYGYFDGDANTAIGATATGIMSGAGEDRIANEGSINISAKSDASLTTGSGSLYGVNSALSNITSEVTSRGIDSGNGSDLIINKGTITVGPSATDYWMSKLTSTNFSLVLGGVTSAESSLFAYTSSSGLYGGTGNDTFFNTGNLDITATSYSSSTGTSIGIFGTSNGGGSSGATTGATGIAGGNGLDEIHNGGLIKVTSNSEAHVSGTSFTFGGTGQAGGGLNATTTAIGISGGNDQDWIFNEAGIVVDAKSKLVSSGDSITPFGTSASDFTTGANTTAIGISSGSGLGYVHNKSGIGITASSTVSQSGSSFAFGGTSNTGGTLSANTNATGIKAEDDADEILNDATITANGYSTLTSTGGSITPFGTSATDPDSGAITRAYGINAGDGENLIRNTALLDIKASSIVSINGSTFTFGGTGAASGKLAATSEARGIATGKDADNIWTGGDLDINATASLSSSNKANTVFGTADAGAHSGTDISAFGIDSGAGRDYIHAEASIDVNATATVNLNASSYSFGGTSGTGGTLSALASAVGIAAGTDDDYIKSEGSIDVVSSSSLTAKSGTNTTFGSSGGGTKVGADSRAAGIDAGSGDDVVKNLGTINVNANASLSSTNSSYVFGGFSATDSAVSSVTTATGIMSGAGKDFVLNSGTINIDTSSTDSNNGSAYAEFGGSRTAGTVTSRSYSRGIDAGADDDVIINKGTIDVKGIATSSSTHNSDTGFLFGGGDARARSATYAYAYGIDTGSGNNLAINKQDINVIIYGNAVSNTYSDGADIFDGDAYSRSDTNSTVIARGITAGSGDDTLVNKGNITTTTARVFTIPILGDIEFPSGASSYAYADGDGIDGDGTVVSYATSSVESTGIYAGDGNNSLYNINNIDVKAKAYASATSDVDSDAGGTSSTTRRARVYVHGYGIRTGSGSDHVVNEGNITVYTIASSNTSINHITATAVGISTGAGDDVIENQGTITTSINRNGVISAGTAIDTGAGNDSVTLNDASVTNGDINLGADNDTLTLVGAPVIHGAVSGNEGTNILAFESAGTVNFSTGLSDFSRAIKSGSGTYTVTALSPLQSIEVQQGTLRIDGDYTFMAGSSFVPAVMCGTNAGRLEITGDIDFAGSIDVINGHGHHLDGDRQVVLHADNGFANRISYDHIHLPAPTPLLTYHSEVTNNDVVVNASVKPFMTVARNQNEMAIANYLQGLLPNAKGDISNALGQVQAIPAGGHPRAFKSLSPESYVNSQQAVEVGLNMFSGTVHQRIQGLRNLRVYHQFVQPGFMSFEQGQLRAPLPDNNLQTILNARQGLQRQHGTWVKSYQQSGQLDATSNNLGYHFDATGVALGVDKWLDQKRAIGFSMASNKTQLDSSASTSHSDIESQLFSVYSTYMTDKAYVDGSLSFGHNIYDTRRYVTVGTISDTVFSQHDGNQTAGSVGTGLLLPLGHWRTEVYANLNYQQQKEDGFQESGAGGIDLNVAPRTTDSLMSKMGLRFSRQYNGGRSNWYTQMGIAWLHEFKQDTTIQAFFVDGQTGAIIVQGQDIAKDGALISLGLNYTNGKGLTASAEYAGQRRGNYSDNQIAAHFQYQF